MDRAERDSHQGPFGDDFACVAFRLYESERPVHHERLEQVVRAASYRTDPGQRVSYAACGSLTLHSVFPPREAVVKPSERDQICVNTIRFLSVDMVEKANSGHPGAPHGGGAHGLRTVDSIPRPLSIQSALVGS